jgi:hypothetical protein
MMEDDPTVIEHGSRRRVMGNFRSGSRRGIYLRNSLSIISMSSILLIGRSYGARV